MKKIALKNAARGTAFDYAGQSWILLENDPTGRTLCLSKDITETRAFDENNCNNFAVASSNKYLNGPYLDNLVDACNGANAFLESELDLTTDDGLKDYGTCTVTIFLLTVDQYRRNRDVIPNADDWWWLSTAFSTKSNGYESLRPLRRRRWRAARGPRLLRQPRPAPRLLSGLRSPDLRRGRRSHRRRHARARRRDHRGAGRAVRRHLRHRGSTDHGPLVYARHPESHPREGGRP